MKLSDKNLHSSAEEILLQLLEEEIKDLPYTLGVTDLTVLLPHSRTKIYLMLESGELPGKKIGGKWVLPRAIFLAWLNGEDFDESIIETATVKQ